MIWLAVTLVAGLVSAGVAVYRSRPSEPRCPACHVPYELVSAAGQGPNAAYDVLACPFCACTATRVPGTRSPLAWCPACHGQSLHVRCIRLPGDPLEVEVHELCAACEYEREYSVGEGGLDRPLGKVIPFPVDRARQRRPPRDDDASSGGNVHTL
ncbi:MAG TPA: hypothetical protein PKA64_10275 [Myxococcota bacterium]|nr:hypothetical protein [Myxococcota bacterium]